MFLSPSPSAIYTLSVHDALPIFFACAVDRKERCPLIGESSMKVRVEDELDEEGSAAQIGLSGSSDRKSTRLNSSHTVISYAVFCLKKKKFEKRQYKPE